MQVSQERFNLTPTEQARLSQFDEYIWYNSEVCNHCFTRVREIEQNSKQKRLSSTSLRNLPAEFHERTDDASQEWCGWDNTKRYGTCFCESCGGDLRASHKDLPLSKLKEFAVNLDQYVREHTPLTLERERFARELVKQKKRRCTQGCESQTIAVAFVRGLQTRHNTPRRATAD